MGRSRRGGTALSAFFVTLAVVSGPFAGNADPDGIGWRFAYAENAGWLTVQPEDDPAMGLHVSDFELTGWMWGENLGWISLSCRNTSSCLASEFAVRNDGQGMLSGYAWGENIGWINFRPGATGVVIDSASGRFGGYAWSENVGWISFASAPGASPVYGVETDWTCNPLPPVPPGPPRLKLSQTHGPERTVLSWDMILSATGYDLVRGDLTLLQYAGGDFGDAGEECLLEKTSSSTLFESELPEPGRGFWYLLRGANCGGNGSYDWPTAAQLEPRDTSLQACSPAR